jgi:phosphoglycolate phosphatase-like HAD superfamily hydrolase
VSRSKPYPDIFASAMEKLGKPEANATCVVGDTPYDALAAGKLGLPTLGVLSGGFSPDDLRAAGCRVLMKDPAELLARYEASPRHWPWGEAGVTAASDDE